MFASRKVQYHILRPFPDGFPYIGLFLVGTTTFVGWEQQPLSLDGNNNPQKVVVVPIRKSTQLRLVEAFVQLHGWDAPD